jgi:hypothetical protein
VASHAPTITAPATMSDLLSNVKVRIPSICCTLRPEIIAVIRPENRSTIATELISAGKDSKNCVDGQHLCSRTA